MELRVALVSAIALAMLTGLSAQQPEPRILDDRQQGEPDRIERRREWFYGSRRAGTSSDQEMRRLRQEAVDATRAALELQRIERTEAGLGGDLDLWVGKGPSPSNFGGWSFGTIAGRVSALAADWAGGMLYVATASGGVWKSANDGQTWVSVFDSAGTMAVGTVAVDPTQPQVVWVGTGENQMGCDSYFGIGLLRSTDGGASWEVRNGSAGASLDGLATFADVIVDPRDSNHVVTGGRIRGCDDGSSAPGGIFTTDDAGASWTERLAGREVYEIAQHPTQLDTYWAATSSGVYKSIDNAVSWTLQTASGLPSGNTGRTEIAIAPSNGDTVYALFDNSGDSFWRTTNGGASWTQMATGACDGQCWYNMVLRVDPWNPSIVYRGTVRLFKTLDGGASWTALTAGWGPSQQVHQDTHVLLMHPSQPGTFYVGSDGGLWKSSDAGASFSNRIGNLNVTQFYAVGTGASDPESIVCGGAQDNSSLARTTSNVWDLQFASGDGFVCHIDPQNPNRAYVTSYPNSGFPSVYRSQTGLFGSYSEITVGNGIIAGESSNWVTPYLVDPNDPQVLYLGTQRAYRSTNYGSSWTPQGPGDFTAGGSNSLVALELNANFPTRLWTGSTDGRVWRTKDAGTNWTNITAGLPGGRSVNDLAADPTAPDRVFAVLGGFNTDHLWEWNEGGSWVARGAGLPNVPANTVLLLGPSSVLVGTDVGVFRSLDGGLTFTPYMEGMPLGAVVTDLKLDLPDLVTAGTYGRGAWQVHVDAVAPVVRYDSVTLPLVEDDGDGDNKVEPGETWSVEPVLRNLGGTTAVAVSARLATSTGGVTVLAPEVGQFGDLAGGAATGPASPFRFAIDPDFPCGAFITFDLVDIHSANEPGSYPDAPAAFSVEVLDHKFTPGGGGGGAPATISLGPALAASTTRQTVGDRLWLHAAGTDAGGGMGVAVPRNALGARWTASDAGQLVIDAVADGRDEYTQLPPGFVAGSWDLKRFRGQQVWLAYVTSPGVLEAAAGGIEFLALAPGQPICDVSPWPGSVQQLALRREGAAVEFSWSPSCNLAQLSQTYAVHAGSLDTLQSSGAYSHAPLSGACNLLSPALLTPGLGNEYYLVVPNGAGREGGFGAQSDGTPRPQGTAVCGEPREADCP